MLPELWWAIQTLIVDLETLLEVLHLRQVSQLEGFEGAAWMRWGAFSVFYGVKLHLLCATNRVPVSYELIAANVAEEARLVGELLAEVRPGEEPARSFWETSGLPSLPKRGVAGEVGRGRRLPSVRAFSSQHGKRQQA